MITFNSNLFDNFVLPCQFFVNTPYPSHRTSQVEPTSRYNSLQNVFIDTNVSINQKPDVVLIKNYIPYHSRKY